MKSVLALIFSAICSLSVSAAISASTIYSNLGPGDSVKNTVHDVISQVATLEHAARFTVSGSTDYFLDSIDLPIHDALLENEGIETFLDVHLRADASGEPGAILETITVDVLAEPPASTLQTDYFSSNTILIAGGTYWISLVAINPGRAGWFTNNQLIGGYAVRDPDEAWLVIDNGSTTPQGAFRLSGTAVPEPSTAALLAIGLSVLAVHRARAVSEGEGAGHLAKHLADESPIALERLDLGERKSRVQ